MSDASLTTHPNNTAAAFTCDLAQPIDLASTGDRWEVGLCELTTSPLCSGTFVATSFVVKDAQKLGITDWPSLTETAGTFKLTPIVTGSADSKGKYFVGDKHLLVNCDVIVPQLVGGELVRCLRTLVAPSAVNQYTFHKVYYIPVENGLLRNIRIELITSQGKQWEFKDKRYPTKVVLHFRRSRKST